MTTTTIGAGFNAPAAARRSGWSTEFERIYVLTAARVRAGSRKGAPPIKGPLRRAIDTLLLWRARARERRMLVAMDPRMRRDLGLAEVDVWREANKHVWQA
jgi:uncharacterized protein YjiS (DUF1127 family)